MSKEKDKVGVLFVCLGNICRSPTAEAVFKKVVEEEGLSDRFHIDSAGTGSWHAGEPADSRSRLEATKHGIDMAGKVARQVRKSDFDDFDYILAMDEQNFEVLEEICPDEHHLKLRLFMEYAPKHGMRGVPDPYYGGKDGFAKVFHICEDGSKGLLEELVAEFGLRNGV